MITDSARIALCQYWELGLPVPELFGAIYQAGLCLPGNRRWVSGTGNMACIMPALGLCGCL